MRIRKALVLASLVALVPALTGLTTPGALAAPAPLAQAHPVPGATLPPVTFAHNDGQAAAGIRYLGASAGVGVAFTDTGVTLDLTKGKAGHASASISLRFLDAKQHPAVTGAERSSAVVNDFHGSDPATWHAKVPTYGEVVYHDLWPGIDAIFSARHGTLKYSFTVAPGANPDRIRLAYTGADRVALDNNGDLAITKGASTLHDQAPRSYQTAGGSTKNVATRYQLFGQGAFGFALARHSSAAKLTIDPGIDYGTFLGGTNGDGSDSFSVGTDAAGNLYVFGQSESPDFPTTAGSYQPTMTPEVGDDIDPVDFTITKLDPTGRLVYSTFVGGSRVDSGSRGVVTSDGSVYVTGVSYSPDFPTTANAYRRTPYLGGNQGVAFEIDPTGSRLVYGTYLAPGLNPNSIKRVSDGSVVVVGTESADYAPTTPGAFQTIYPGGTYTGYAVRLNPTGSGIVFATYLGAPVTDQGDTYPWAPSCGFSLGAVDDTGASYVTGQCPHGFPLTPGGRQPTGNGSNVALAKLDPSGRQLDYATYISDAGDLQVVEAGPVALDSAGNAYLAVESFAGAITTTPDAYQQQCQTTAVQPYCAAILEYDSTGHEVYGTYFGAPNGSTSPSGIAVDSAGRVYLSGTTSEGSNMPVTSNAYSTSPGDFSVPFFVAVLGKGSLLYSTYFGGTGSACLGALCGFVAGDIVMSPNVSSGSVYLGGSTASPDFPVTPGAVQGTYPGGPNEIWAAKLTLPDLGGGG